MRVAVAVAVANVVESAGEMRRMGFCGANQKDDIALALIRRAARPSILAAAATLEVRFVR